MNEKIDLVSLPKKSFWKLSVPIIAFCLFDAIYGIVDMVWVSKIGVEAFFAMGVSIPIVSLIFSFGDSIGQGTNSIMSRFIGSGDYESSYNALIHGMILANIIWVISVFCLIFANGILYYLNKTDSYILIFEYMVPIVIFAYVFIFVNFFSETLQAEGNSRLPTILLISSNILNIILDPIFIFYLDLGIKGAAYATVLSAFIVLVIVVFYYLSGRAKIPLSLKYFRFRPYIIVEIFKVALPNFLDDGLWCFSATFMNSMLLMTMGEMGPILYSVSNKLKTLLVAPVKGYGRGLMSVTGHLFGAKEFDELKNMFNYVLKVSLITTLVVMVVFVVFRDYAFSLFSITGMQTEVFWIAVGGTVIMLAIPFSMIASKMLDGFGLSIYSLLFTFLKIIFEMLLIVGLYHLLDDASSILIGIMVTEIVFSVIYYVFINYLFSNFNEKFKDRGTVKSFDDDDNQGLRQDDDDERGLLSKIPSLLALIAMGITFLQILILPIKLQNYNVLIGGIIAFIGGSIGIYLINRLHSPKLSVIGFFIVAGILLVFMGRYGFVSTLLFVIAGILVLYTRIIVKKLRKS